MMALHVRLLLFTQIISNLAKLVLCISRRCLHSRVGGSAGSEHLPQQHLPSAKQGNAWALIRVGGLRAPLGAALPAAVAPSHSWEQLFVLWLLQRALHGS